MRTALVLLAAASAALPVTAQAAPDVRIDASGPVVELNIYESVDAAPDIATIGAGVTTEAPTATEALRRNSAEMQKVIARIKALGVAEKDIQTTGISLNAQYDYSQDAGRPVFRGYQAANRVSVILRKVDDTGRVLDALVEAGATDLGGPSFAIDNQDAARDTARQRAMARAGAQARAYAAMLGYDDARVLSITENMEGRGAMPELGLVKLAASADAVPPVQPGMVSTGVSIAVTYQLVKSGTPAAP